MMRIKVNGVKRIFTINEWVMFPKNIISELSPPEIEIIKKKRKSLKGFE